HPPLRRPSPLTPVYQRGDIILSWDKPIARNGNGNEQGYGFEKINLRPCETGQNPHDPVSLYFRTSESEMKRNYRVAECYGTSTVTDAQIRRLHHPNLLLHIAVNVFCLFASSPFPS